MQLIYLITNALLDHSFGYLDRDHCPKRSEVSIIYGVGRFTTLETVLCFGHALLHNPLLCAVEGTMFLLQASHAILEGHVRILTSDTQPRTLSYKQP